MLSAISGLRAADDAKRSLLNGPCVEDSLGTDGCSLSTVVQVIHSSFFILQTTQLLKPLNFTFSMSSVRAILIPTRCTDACSEVSLSDSATPGKYVANGGLWETVQSWRKDGLLITLVGDENGLNAKPVMWNFNYGRLKADKLCPLMAGKGLLCCTEMSTGTYVSLPAQITCASWFTDLDTWGTKKVSMSWAEAYAKSPRTVPFQMVESETARIAQGKQMRKDLALLESMPRTEAVALLEQLERLWRLQAL